MGNGLYGYELWMAQKEARELVADGWQELALLLEEELVENWRASQNDPCNIGSLKDYLRASSLACQDMSALECYLTEDDMILF